MNRACVVSAVVSVIATATLVSAADSSSFTGLRSGGASSSSSKTATIPYTTKKGDTLTSLAEKFDSTARTLKKLNHLTSAHLHEGMVLEIPATRRASRLAAKTTSGPAKKPVVLTAQQQHALDLQAALRATDKYSHHTAIAQPVQDVDLSPSTFASCPPPPSDGAGRNVAALDEDNVAPPSVPAPPVSLPPTGTAATLPADTSYPEPLAVQNAHTLLPVPAALPTPATPPPQQAPTPSTFSAARSGSTTVAFNSPTTGKGAPPMLTPTAQPKKSFASALSDFFGGGSHGMNASEGGEWGNRFLSETRNLAAQGVSYDGSWRPDGESHRWEMDCSNTSRYLYQVTAGIQLPRTASDQYYYLHLQDKAWDVPMTSAGFADCNYLRNNLKPGDLLFWENTYRPERQPPITHVMIFLGSDDRGRWLMAGSQGSRGFYNPRHSGPDVYVFDPTHAVGGYTSWLGLERHHGRFVAYGRPLEADVKKLTVATND
jgi:cell wall-associated NlpC family hydrolase